MGRTLPAERGVRLLSDHSAGQSAPQETLGADRGYATTKVETSREYAQRIELAPDADKRTTEALLPGRVAEPSALEHLRQLTGVEQPAQLNLLDQLAQLTGAQSPDSVTSQDLLQQLNEGDYMTSTRGTNPASPESIRSLNRHRGSNANMRSESTTTMKRHQSSSVHWIQSKHVSKRSYTTSRTIVFHVEPILLFISIYK